MWWEPSLHFADASHIWTFGYTPSQQKPSQMQDLRPLTNGARVCAATESIADVPCPGAAHSSTIAYNVENTGSQPLPRAPTDYAWLA